MNTKPRVLRILNRFNVGGPVYNVTYLSRYMEPEFETLLAGGNAGENEESSLYILEQNGIKPVLLDEMQRSLSALGDVRSYQRIRELIREFRPHIVHTHASKAGAVGRMAAFHEKVPVVVHTFHGHVFHSYFGKTRTTVFKQIERYLARRSDRIVAISDKLKQELVYEHGITTDEKVSVVPLGFDLEPFTRDREARRKAFRQAWNIAEDTLLVGLVGRMVPVKNHRLLTEAAAALKNKTGRNVQYLLVGDGESRNAIISDIQQSGLSYTYKQPAVPGTDFVLTSWQQNTPDIYAALDITVLCSFNEGTPVSLIEAQAAGIPVLSTRVGGIENVVREGSSALLTTTDTAEFTAALEKMLTDNELRSRMAGAGRDFAMQHFHYTRLVDDMRQLYYELLRKKGLEFPVPGNEIYR